MHAYEIEEMMVAAERTFEHELRIVEEELGHRHPRDPRKRGHRLVLTTSINKSILILMTAEFAANQQQAFQFGLIDEVTNQPVTGTFTGGAVVSDTPAVVTGSVDNAGNVNLVAVAPGKANVTASALTAFTDSTGKAQSKQLSTDPIPVTIDAVVTADGVKLVLTAGAITQQPSAAAPAGGN
jgi:hypothetical protein